MRSARPTDPAVASTQAAAASTPAATKAAAEQLALIREELKVLQNTKSSQGPGGKREPLGVVIHYRLRLCGFAHRATKIYWSLFDTKHPPQLPYLWDYQRLANIVTERAANCDDVEPSFWVPIPAISGRFSLTLTVFDYRGATRSRRRSAPFRS